tara:strand:+ start:2767 stop:3093 length:327 start_codon:yes stop_codon:yes gene_type:complete
MNKLQIISNDCENYNYNNNYNINDLMLLLVKFENYIEILNNIRRLSIRKNLYPKVNPYINSYNYNILKEKLYKIIKDIKKKIQIEEFMKIRIQIYNNYKTINNYKVVY